MFNPLHGIGHLGTRATVKLISGGRACRTAVPGHEHACLASGRIYPGTSPHLWGTSLCLHSGSSIFTSISLAQSNIRRFQILPYGSRPLYTLAGSHCPAGHHSRDGSQSPAVACPQTITNDQGRHFESQLLNSLAIMCGINLSYTTAFQPAANGLVERMHRSIKAAILCRLQERWTKAFPLGIRKAFKDLQASVLELFFEEPLRIPGELLAAPPTTGIHQSSLHSSAPIRITVASPSGTSHIPRWLCPQGPGRLYRCLLPAGYNTAPPGNALQWPLQSLGRHTKNDAHRHKRSARQLRPTGIYPSSSRQRQMATLQPLEYPRSRQHKPHHSPAHKTQSQDSSF